MTTWGERSGPFLGVICACLAFSCGNGSGSEPSGGVSGAAGASSGAAGAGSVTAGAGGDSGAAGASNIAGGAGTGPDGSTMAGDVTVRIYDADDAHILYSGRIDLTDPKKPKFSGAATSIAVKFKGVACTAMLKDENRYGMVKNYYDVIVDGGPPTKLAALASQTDYEVASKLPYGEHTVTLVKRTEAAIGFTQFFGFKISGEILTPPARPVHRMEFIGDSITCGSGDEAANDSPQCMEDGFGQPYQESYLAYGPVLARSVGAEYHVTSVSGIGLYRNYSSLYDARPMPAVYDLLFIEEMVSPPWDTKAFVPDAIVIGLGTNDFSPGDSARPAMDQATMSKAYIDFITTLRGYYQDAHIFGISSPMLGDGWPQPTDRAASDLKEILTTVVDHFAAMGDTKVHKFYVTKIIGDGCGTHPSAAQHAATAAELGAYVKSVMGW